MAYSIPRRAGTAVARNRLRRRLRAAVDQIVDEMAPGAYLVLPDPAAATMAFDDVIASLREALAAAGADRRDEQ